MNDLHCEQFEQMLADIDVDEVYLRQLFDIYHQRLLDNISVCRKLKRRGVAMELILSSQIGYCDRTLNRYVQGSHKPDGAGFRGTLRRVGLTKPNGHELFRGCIVEPMFDGDILVAACGIKLICPSRPAPRVIHWFRQQVYTRPLTFSLMHWGGRYVAH